MFSGRCCVVSGYTERLTGCFTLIWTNLDGAVGRRQFKPCKDGIRDSIMNMTSPRYINSEGHLTQTILTLLTQTLITSTQSLTSPENTQTTSYPIPQSWSTQSKENKSATSASASWASACLVPPLPPPYHTPPHPLTPNRHTMAPRNNLRRRDLPRPQSRPRSGLQLLRRRRVLRHPRQQLPHHAQEVLRQVPRGRRQDLPQHQGLFLRPVSGRFVARGCKKECRELCAYDWGEGEDRPV